MDWLNALLAEFGERHWCVTVDIDELLCYPGSEFAPLRALTAFLDRAWLRSRRMSSARLVSWWAVGRLALTRKATTCSRPRPISTRGHTRESRSTCVQVFSSGAECGNASSIRSFERGGRRHGSTKGFAAVWRAVCHAFTISDGSGRRAPPVLTKVPLVRWDQQTRYLSPHWVSPKIVAPVTGALLHFKFLADFHERAVHEAARGEHYDGAAEYRRYARTLDRRIRTAR